MEFLTGRLSVAASVNFAPCVSVFDTASVPTLVPARHITSKGPETASGPGSTQAGSRQRPSSSMPAMGSRGAQAGSQSNLKSPLASSSGPAGGPATARATRAGPTSPLPGGTASAPAKGHLSTGAGGSQSKLKSAGGAGSLASASASAGSSGPAGGSSSSSLKNLKKSAKGEGASRSSSTCAVQ
eukprot:353770-Rhodomonas_salina.3